MSKTTFQIVAEEFAAAFTRDNPRGVWSLKDESPEWMRDAIHDAHTDGRLPDDWIYENCASMVGSIAESSEADEVETCEIADGCVDIYTDALTAWLASNACNVEACDECVSEGLYEPMTEGADGITKWLQRGQYLLLDRACAALVCAIETQADERDSEAEDPTDENGEIAS